MVLVQPVNETNNRGGYIMNTEEYLKEYRTIDVDTAIDLCDQHGVYLRDFFEEYPGQGLTGWIDTRCLLWWLGY